MAVVLSTAANSIVGSIGFSREDSVGSVGFGRVGNEVVASLSTADKGGNEGVGRDGI